MATLNFLKSTLRQKATEMALSPTQPLSDSQYDAGFNNLAQGFGQTTYEDFIIPQLSLLLESLLASHARISVLEIGPGPKSVLGGLPNRQRRKIKRYAAFEPNEIFATILEGWLSPLSNAELPLPCLENSPSIRRIPFVSGSGTDVDTNDEDERFDVILFCHSMYGMESKRKSIEKALALLTETPEDGIVVVFHRDGSLHFDGLTCHRTASFPAGIIRVADSDEVLNSFTRFIAGFVMKSLDADKAVQAEWRKVCRAFGRCEEAHPGHLFFDSPNIMVAFTRHATSLPELMANVPAASVDNAVKNREARDHRPASIMKPQEVRHVQQCVRWALDHGVSLTIVGGGHSSQCLWPNVVAVDMGAFNQVHILADGEPGISDPDSDSLITVGAGCKAGDVICTIEAAGFTLPLGARPSVGAGLWLQGGIGHLGRLHGLACDAIVGAVVVSVASSEVLCIGRVPSQHQPIGSVYPENGIELLWGLKGAGTNLGIVVSVTFKASAAPAYSIQSWIVPLDDKLEAKLKLKDFDQLVASKLPRHCSADAYLYWEQDKLRLGISMCESSTKGFTYGSLPAARAIFGQENNLQTVDGVGLFDTEMYMSEMHGGHASGKTSSFKRCVFLKDIGAVNIVDLLVEAVESRPSPHCYLHLLQGGGAVHDVAASDTAFGCRDWDFACVITGVWRRNEGEANIARAAVQWVYNVASDLLPVSSGVYGADLGPDPRDAALAAKAFGPNLSRLARLKYNYDPGNVLAYACPLPKAPTEPKLIVLVTGESCAGKDHSADNWVSDFASCSHTSLSARAVSISDSTKREYAAATGADLKRLLEDRVYKEQHRSALSTYFRSQVRLRQRLPEEHFLHVVHDAGDVDVLFITGMRDEAPVAAFSHLVPDSRLLEVQVTANGNTRQTRRGCQETHIKEDTSDIDDTNTKGGKDSNNCPSFVFNNDAPGNKPAKVFSERHLLPFFSNDLQQLKDMVRLVPNFPRRGIKFHDVLGISQHSGGLDLCTTLLQSHFAGDWTKVDAVACCETGGFLYAPGLAAKNNVRLALIREAGKLPPPKISVTKSPSHISSSAPNDSTRKRIELGLDILSRDATVVVVDDVLATGETLCAVLQLLGKAGIDAQRINVMVVAEFPVHRGRELLRRRGLGGIDVQSLLVFGGN